MRVLITGASGLIGSALRQSLESDGHEVIRLVRRDRTAPDERSWDPAAGMLNQPDVDGFDVVVHLAGAGIGDRRWSEERKRLILDSRIQGTELLAQRLASVAKKPSVLISGSAIGYYGDRPEPVSEGDGPADPSDFLSDLCVAWEGATGAAEAAGIRTVHIRTGLVLARSGGALGKLLLPFRLGVGGRLGSGATWWSWITLHDHVRAIRHVIENPVSGPVNLTAPNPATNAEVTKALGKVLRRPTLLPAPRFALRLLLGKDLADALLFTSNQVLPGRLQETAFEFDHPTIDPALHAVLD